MELVKLTLIYLFAILACSFLLLMDIPTWLIVILLILYVFMFTLYPHFNALWWTNNLKKIDRFLKRNKQKALFAYPYAIAHESLAEQKDALQRIISTHQQPYIKHNYACLLALLEEHYDQALTEAKQIQKEPYQSYMIAHSEALLGNIENAREMMPQLTEKWMVPSIESLISYKEANQEEFGQHSSLAIKKARGVQKYLLYYSFSHMEKKNN
ncbi:hypothetical protein [Rummeliibacillus stabekisii]|uniref:hypothetical protein n=1 Tax=Rummeliibacillus stabekisii TaxID=241244 RepID=UPI00116700DA|nr:hypothetical protein [Rummeliibacillus stabekisii]MBB5170582.1 hypothetical protein [Rummeliibacillus stabekisii]GEL04836.1 hypothetical protein RST01_14630 [Rummeliibacillus stabekisii]